MSAQQTEHPTELELFTDAYPDVDPANYQSWEDLADAMWWAHGEDLMQMYTRIGGDIYPDPFDTAARSIDHAADVLWNAHTRG